MIASWPAGVPKRRPGLEPARSRVRLALLSFERPAGETPRLRPRRTLKTAQHGHDSGRDVRYETDFRAVYARVIDSWLGSSSVQVLGAVQDPEVRRWADSPVHDAEAKNTSKLRYDSSSHQAKTTRGHL